MGVREKNSVKSLQKLLPLPVEGIWYIVTLIFLGLIGGCGSSSNQVSDIPNKPNVLFIAVDDLRPELGCYGQSQILSPNIDKLASEGFLFERAYCNIPVCGASRASIITGLRPTPQRFLTHNSYVDEDAPGIVTLPQYFKNNGYQTLSLGKVLHNWEEDALQSWSEPPWHPRSFVPGTSGRQRLNYLLPINQDKRPPVEKADVPDSAYHDGKIANRTIKELENFANTEEPFFMAVGFVKPHLPFNAPAKYWNLYAPASITLPSHSEFPSNAPKEAYHNSSELRTYDSIPAERKIPDETVRELMHGYYACVSYVDAQIGRIWEKLNELNLADNTIIVLWGDHGWSLGEHSLWCKHSTFNVAMQAPLIVLTPNKKGGEKIKGLVEFVDIYPTLTDLAGLAKPEHLQGESFSYLLDDPGAKGKEAVFGQWNGAEVIKTDKYGYTEWPSNDNQPPVRMLYDHESDPDETVNLSEEPELAELVNKFSEMIQENRAINEINNN